MKLTNEKLIQFVNAVNANEWKKALEINKNLLEELTMRFDKSVYHFGMAVLHYYSQDGKTTEDFIKNIYHEDLKDFHESAQVYTDIKYGQLIIDAILYKADKLEKEGKFEEAYQSIRSNGFIHIYPFSLEIEMLMPVYSKLLMLMNKINHPLAFYALKTLKQSGFTLTEEISALLNSTAYNKFEESIEHLKNYEVKKDAIIFPENINFEYTFDPHFIAIYYPELYKQEIKKWVFKKDVRVNGHWYAAKKRVEINGNIHITGNLRQTHPPYGAGMLFKKNLHVDGYIKAGGSYNIGIPPASFTCEGELKAAFIAVLTKINIKGKIHPDTLIILLRDLEPISDYPCHTTKELNGKYWGKKQGVLWDDVLEDYKKGIDIFNK